MFRRLSQKAFASISEVVVTAIIFTVAAAGILSTISSIRSKGGDSGRRLQAAYAAKQQMDLLRGQIDARMWLNSQSDVYPGVVHSSVYDVNGVFIYNVPISLGGSSSSAITINTPQTTNGATTTTAAYTMVIDGVSYTGGGNTYDSVTGEVRGPDGELKFIVPEDRRGEFTL